MAHGDPGAESDVAATLAAQTRRSTIAVIHRADPQFTRLALIMLTVALAIATVLAIYFAATRTSIVSDDGGSPAPPSVGQDEPCWAPNVPC